MSESNEFSNELLTEVSSNEVSSNEVPQVVGIDEVKYINDSFAKEILNKLESLKLEYQTLTTSMDDIKKHLIDKSEEIENIMHAVQTYSGSIHIAMNKTSSSIDVINNIINTVGMPRNTSSHGASKSSVSSVSNNNSSIINSSSGARSTKRAVSINVLFSHVFRLFAGDEVIEAPDLAAIIEKYESNNKINLRELMHIDVLLKEESDKLKFEDSWNKLKKDSEKTAKKKATIIWPIAKLNKDFYKKFEAFKTHYGESSENKA